MLSVISGTPGAGKTLLAVWEIVSAVQSGRLVYACVDGLNVPGVQPLPDSGWTACKDGSLIVIDEAQQFFPADKDRRSQLPKSEIEAMELHRHRGIDLILVTQHPRLINSHVLALVGNHRHLVRMAGTHNVRLYTMDQCAERLSKADLRAALVVAWRHPKGIYGWYKSATIHTKPRIPRVLIFGAAAVPAMAAFAFYGISHFFSSAVDVPETPFERVEAARSAVVERPAPAERLLKVAKAADRITGCYSDRLRCRCMGPGGAEISEEQCRGLIGSPIRSKASADAVAANQAQQIGRALRFEEGILASK